MSVEGYVYTAAHIATRPLIEAWFGTFNSAVFADIENMGDPVFISSRFEDALTDSDSRVFARAAMLRVNVPEKTSSLYSELVKACTALAGVYLFKGRGQVPPNQSKGISGLFQAEEEKAEERLTTALIASRDLYGVTGTWVAAPAALSTGNRSECGYYGQPLIGRGPFGEWW